MRSYPLSDDRYVQKRRKTEPQKVIETSIVEALKTDPTGMFGPTPRDGGLENTIEKVLDAHEKEGRLTRAEVKTTHFRIAGNELRPLIDTQFFDEGLFPAIHEAKRYILLAALCFGHDDLGKALTRMLKEKLAEGVAVAIIVDGYFGWDNFRHVAEELQAAGAQVFRARARTTGVEHRKALVVDGERAFLGGTCLENPSYWSKRFQKTLETGIAPMRDGEVDLAPPHADVPEWHDLQMEVIGPAAQQLAADLLLAIRYHGGNLDPKNLGSREAIREFWFPKLEATGDLAVRLGQSVPFQRNDAQATGRATIDYAKRSLYMHFAYFTCREYFDAIVRALERGVQVHIGMPGGFDSALHHYAWRKGLNRLFEASKGNLHVYEYTKDLEAGRSGYNHDKWIVADEELIWTSTGNPEFFSKYMAFDSSLSTKSASLSKTLIEEFNLDASRSDEITPKTQASMSLREKWLCMFYGAMMIVLDFLVAPFRARGDVY